MTDAELEFYWPHLRKAGCQPCNQIAATAMEQLRRADVPRPHGAPRPCIRCRMPLDYSDLYGYTCARACQPYEWRY